MSITIAVYNASGVEKQFTNGIRLIMDRELYTPYVKLSGEFICDKALSLSDVCNIRLIWNTSSNIFFNGIPDNVVVSHKGGIKRISFTARSYTSLAGQNEPEPGIISDVDLSGLVNSCLVHSQISVEQNTPVENYIYVKPSSNLWEAICAYTVKRLNRMPYIYANNTIMATKSRSTDRDYTSVKLVTEGIGINTVSMLSDVHMRLGNDQYQYSQTNQLAQDFKIKRSKYYELDRQWLNDPNQGLTYKLARSNRRCRIKFFEYCSFKNEQLFDRVTNSGTACDGMYINRVVLNVDSKGTRTRVYCYNDDFGQR